MKKIEIYKKLLSIISSDDDLDVSSMDNEELYYMMYIARIHGVLGSVLKKDIKHKEIHNFIFKISNDAWKKSIAQGLKVRECGNHILDCLKKSNIPSVLIKGIDFSDNLYSYRNERVTYDIDLFVPKEYWYKTVNILKLLGCEEKKEKHKIFLGHGTYGERTWLYPFNNIKMEVDLHWNLICEPEFRKETSIEFWDLNTYENLGMSSAARLIIASIHALYHHQFDKMSLLLDIKMACEKIKDNDIYTLKSLSRKTHSCLALNTSLQVAFKYLSDQKINDIRNECLGDLIIKKIPNEVFDHIENNIFSINSPRKNDIKRWLSMQSSRASYGYEFLENQIYFY